MSEGASLRSDSSTLGEVGAAIKREGRELADEAKTTAQRMARDQRDAVASFVSALAGAAGRGAEELEQAGYGKSAAVISRAAGEVESLAQQLQQREPEALWAEVEDFTREHPWLVFGAGFALAFGLSRFLRSEPSHETSSRETSYDSSRDTSYEPSYAAADPPSPVAGTPAVPPTAG